MMQFSNHWVTHASLRIYALVKGIKQLVTELFQMRISSLLRSEIQNFFLQALVFILPSLRHHVIAIEVWYRRGVEKGAIDRGGPKVWTDFGPKTMQLI